jgi:hypothetical protein
MAIPLVVTPPRHGFTLARYQNHRRSREYAIHTHQSTLLLRTTTPSELYYSA